MSLDSDFEKKKNETFTSISTPPDFDKEQKKPASSGLEDLHILIEGNDILAQKMTLINDALDEIGYTPYHWKLFFLTGLGYSADIMLLMLVSLTQMQANLEFGKSFPGGPVSLAAGSALGVIFFGTIGDVFGRRLTFNISLFLSCICTLICAGMPSYVGYCFMAGLASFFVSGNLVLDGVVYLEFLPSTHAYMMLVLLYWWAIGQTITTLYCWPLLQNFSCNPYSMVPCVKSDNMGWRYCFILSGGIVLVFSIVRFFFIKLMETPRYSLVSGHEEQLIKDLDKIAESAKRTHSLTSEKLASCGELSQDYIAARSNIKITGKLMKIHIKATYATFKLGFSATILQLIWLLNGFAYPLYSTFLPYYLMTRGAASDTFNLTYRDMVIVSACSIAGPIIATILVVYFPKFGKKGVMVLGSILTGVFLFAYTQVRTQAQNIGFNCAVYASICISYNTLFSYTPEVLPSNFRSTWTSICVSWSRFGGIISPMVAYYTNVSSNVPIFLCASLFMLIAFLSAILPFESVGKRIV